MALHPAQWVASSFKLDVAFKKLRFQQLVILRLFLARDLFSFFAPLSLKKLNSSGTNSNIIIG